MNDDHSRDDKGEKYGARRSGFDLWFEDEIPKKLRFVIGQIIAFCLGVLSHYSALVVYAKWPLF